MVSTRRSSYEVRAHSSASPEQVFDLLADATTWRHWAGPLVLRSWWEREGDPPPGGVGAIRRLGAPGASSREQIVAYERPRHLGYVWLTRLVRDYRADVRLEPDGTGTRIVWGGSFGPTLVGPEPVMRRFFLFSVGGFARRLAAFAEKEQA
jgi:uncharacterized protein YndB with AHSA1/START domain